MGNNTAVFKPLRTHILNSDCKRSAIILGATGATGRYVLTHLLKSNEWGNIKIIHRRKIDFDEIQNNTGYNFTEIEKKKLKQSVINMEQIGDEKYTNEFKNYDCIFCCLGTTRKQAGSAEGFRKVDLYMVRDSAINAKKAGVLQYNLLTSQGANSNIWSNDWSISHSLFYFKIKGLAEESVIKQEFNKISIFRPGMLERGKDKRMFEKIMSGLPTEDLAKCMIYDAENNDKNDNKKYKMYDAKTINNTLKIIKENESKNNNNETDKKEDVNQTTEKKNENNDDAKVEETDNNENINDNDKDKREDNNDVNADPNHDENEADNTEGPKDDKIDESNTDKPQN